MFLVGLTGSIGTGKSTVSQILLSLGVRVIDADAIARDGKKPLQRLDIIHNILFDTVNNQSVDTLNVFYKRIVSI